MRVLQHLHHMQAHHMQGNLRKHVDSVQVCCLLVMTAQSWASWPPVITVVCLSLSASINWI